MMFLSDFVDNITRTRDYMTTMKVEHQSMYLGAEQMWNIQCGSWPMVLLSLALLLMLMRKTQPIPAQDAQVKRRSNDDQEINVRPRVVIPRHIAVIMDGNRRFGRQHYNNALQGHRDGSQTLVSFVDWCQETVGIEALTVFAFSTENWTRDPVEIQALMDIFETFVDRIASRAVENNLRVRVLISDRAPLPLKVLQAVKDIEHQTRDCTGLTLSICVSYGSRHELVQACQSIASDVLAGDIEIPDITEDLVSEKLLTRYVKCPLESLSLSYAIRSRG